LIQRIRIDAAMSKIARPSRSHLVSTWRFSARDVWRALGPGLVTGAADDDPSGIATYSQAGAQFGFSLLWTVFLTLPFMAAIQIISACVGWNTRQGLARNIARVLPPIALYPLIAALLVANTINIAADLAAMGEALRLVTGGSALAFAIVFGVACLIAEVLIPYHRYAGFLKALTLVLLFYVAAAFTVHIPWRDVARATFIPHVTFNRDMLLMVVAVFGTTISPYLFFWQASQEAEESRLSLRRMYDGQPHLEKNAFRSISIDTWIGMIFSNTIAFFIIVTTAATLATHGITHIDTAAQAAEALRPIGGPFAFALFAIGIIGTGLLAVPVLAGSGAYAVAEMFKLRGSLELPVSRAIGFYAIVAAATIGGAALLLTKIDPIAMLFWSAVINGVVAVPIMIATMWVVTSTHRGRRVSLPRWLHVLGWLAAALMAIAVALLIGASF
jgi:NRAMP (natural resistance-associated macrophage protein)-like metal ion transporter